MLSSVSHTFGSPLPASLPAAAAAEWRSLSAERDPELRAEGFLALAGRLEARGLEAPAAAIYEGLLSGEPRDSAPSWSGRARARLDGLLGRGSFGRRTELFLRHFVSDSTDPAALFAMGAAGAAFRVARLGALSRLFGASAAPWSRGFGARAVAGLSGLATEALVFPVAGRLGQAALGRQLEWSPAALGREYASGLLTLGALRLSGAAGRRLSGAWAGQGPAGVWLFSQAGMLGGIWLAQHGESQVGLRPESSASFAEAVATLLHFNVAGRLSRAAFGRGFGAWERRLELQAEALARNGRSFFPPRPLGSPVLAMATVGAESGVGRGAKGETTVLMSAPRLETQGGGGFPPTLYRDYAYPSGQGGREPPRARYSREWLDLWRRWAPRLKAVDAKLPAAELLESRMPLREANRLWRGQIEDFAQLLGASFEVHPSARLLRPFDRGFLPRDPALWRAAEALLGGETEVYELRFPYSSLRFGEPNERGNYSELHSLLLDLQAGFGHQLFLSHRAEGRTTIRLPGLDLWDALNVARFGENAHRLIPVRGVIPRDEVMRLRQNLLAPLGLARQAIFVHELKGKVAPFFFVFHDAYHASIASTLPAFVASSAGRLFWAAKRRLPVSPLKEELLNRLSDLDPGTQYRGDPMEYWRFTLAHYWPSFRADMGRDDFIAGGLHRYPKFLQGYQSVVRRIKPQSAEEAQALEKISSLLREDARRLAELLTEVLRK